MKRTLPNLILKDLTAGQSTASSLAGRLAKPTEQITTILTNLERQDLVEPRPITRGLTAYRITLAGRQTISPPQTTSTP